MSFRLTVLAENTVFIRALKAHHGLSFLIETDAGSIVFDAGANNNIISNAETLGKDLSLASAVVLSHGHYDHSGGLEYLLSVNKTATVRLKPEAFCRKTNTSGQEIGIPRGSVKALENRVIQLSETEEILPGLFAVPEIEITDSRDTHFSGLFKDKNGKTVLDSFEEEVFLVIKDYDGISIITGCSHRGITNIIKTAKKEFNLPVKSVLGGFHLSKEPAGRARQIAEDLLAIPEKPQIGVCHCTGLDAYYVFRSVLAERAFYLSTGTSIEM